MKSWYEIKAAAAGDEADVYLYDEIGGWGVTAKDFIRELNQVKARIINLYINSPGGDVFDGFAIYENLQRHPAAINVTVDGIAASAASYIAQAGNRRVMSKTASMMIHDAWGFAIGPADDMRKLADSLDQMSDTIAGIYADKAGGNVIDWRARMTQETWFNADEAVEAGLADEVAGKVVAIAAISGRMFNLAKFKNVPAWVKQAPQAAGRPMRQANLDQLHTAMASTRDAAVSQQAIHDSTCDMGSDCPENRASDDPANDQEDVDDVTQANRAHSRIRNDLGQCAVPGCDDMASAHVAVCSDHLAGLIAMPGDYDADDDDAPDVGPIYMRTLTEAINAAQPDFASSFARNLQEAS